MTGETVSHYDVIDLLERGAAGPVYKARDRRNDSLVALELLPAPPDAASGERLRREVETASALGHPHICPLLDIGETPGGGLFAVRRLDGETLRSRLAHCPLAPEQALGLASQVAAALGRAHEQGIVHRDLRPSNVLVSAEGQARLAGFGLSWARVNGASPDMAYRSPEQLRGHAVDARSDIWSLGVLLYEMITGRLPFQGAESILEREPEPMAALHPGLPPELDEVVARALAKEPSDRPARMDELLVSLRGLLAGGGLTETDATLVQVPGLRSARSTPEAAGPGGLDEPAGGPAEPPHLAGLTGRAIAQYRILEPLGGGAMGTVYRAEDTRLRRRVALKFLPGELTRDPVAKARFLQEAQAASALDHPNICTIHEVGETPDGHLYLAMAAYDGETVKERLARGALALEEAVDIACQAAQGLAKAHREGIVHRDVKPANLMVTADGMVKILDFGVAKLRGAAGMNVVGSFLGTPAYMSPEQARGEEVDPRSDVFSLGVVLYEMLAGARPFRSGEGVTSALRSLLEDKPAPLRSVRSDAGTAIPVELERVVLRMLSKMPAERQPTAAEVAAELSAIQKALAAMPEPRRAPGRRIWVAAAAVLALVLALAVAVLLRRPDPAPVQAVFTRLTEEEGREVYPSLAPDGRSFAYVGTGPSGQKDLFLRTIGDGGEPFNVTAGSEADDSQPAISPDGRWIAFRSEREGGGIYVASVEGGPARRISEVGYNPAWSPDGRELAVATEGIIDPAVRKSRSAILRIDVATGRSRTVVEADGVQPSWSPHGWRIAYWGLPAGTARRALWTVPVEGGPPTKALDDGAFNWNPVWSPDGSWLYFGSDRSGSLNLWRLPIDERSGEVGGDPEPVTTPSTASGFWSLSRDGSQLLYASNESKSNVERFSFDPEQPQATGRQEAVTRGSHRVRSCAVSPDGLRIAFHASLPREELFVAGADGSQMRQLTDDRYNDRHPQWSPDGRRLLFYSNRGGTYEAWIFNLGRGTMERVLPPGREPVTVPVWSPDGRRVACTYGRTAAVIDLAQPLESRRAEPLAPAEQVGETFYPMSWSADGGKLAGNMARLDGSFTDGFGLYLLASRTYLRWTSRGSNPVWLPDGRRLLYVEAGKVLAFDTRTNEARDVLVPPPHSAYESVIPSPDGRSLFAVRAVDEGDVWLLTLRNQRGEAPNKEEKR